jgi:hypothetical protein
VTDIADTLNARRERRSRVHVVSRGGKNVNGDAGFPFRRVVIESPYAGDVGANVSYARACLLDSLSRGEAPLASHLLYTQVLTDDFEPERMFGIGAGHAWLNVAEAVAVYTDHGISNGMRVAINLAEALAKPIEYRTLKR